MGRAGEPLVHRRLHRRCQNRSVQPAHDGAAHRLEGKGPDEIEDAVDDQCADREQRQHGERIEALAVENPVMNLQHEQRYRELKQVYADTEQRGVK
ncbi:hypothetical protein D3C71_1710460 [compost metagenome]